MLPYKTRLGTWPGILLASLTTLTLPFVAWGAELCKIEYREIGGIPGLPKVKSLACPSTGQRESLSLRLTYVQFGEALIGNLVRHERIPELKQLFDNTLLVDSALTRKLTGVFAFGHKEVYQANDISLLITGSATERPVSINFATLEPSDSSHSLDVQTRVLWSISSPFNSLKPRPAEFPVFLKKESDTITKTRSWPSGYKQYYECQSATQNQYNEIKRNKRKTRDGKELALSCAIVWRFLSLKDLGIIEHDTDEDLARQQKKGFFAPTEATDEWPSPQEMYKLHFRICRHLGASGWPNDFMLIRGGLNVAPQGCGEDLSYAYNFPRISVSGVLLENTSNVTLSIPTIIGSKSTDENLRHEGIGVEGPEEVINERPIILKPGSKAILPLRILLASNDAPSSGTISFGNKLHTYISTAKKDELFVSDDEKITKSRDSFLPPAYPSDRLFEYGPSFALSRIQIGVSSTSVDASPEASFAIYPRNELEENVPEDGPRLELDQPPLPGNSCPYLYYFDANRQVWVRKRKIIDQGNGIGRETTDVLTVPIGASRFRIAELEPETSHIKELKLRLTFNDGRKVDLAPANGESRFPVLITPYSHTDFDFDVPSDFKADSIRTAELIVTGYYERHNLSAASRAQNFQNPQD